MKLELTTEEVQYVLNALGQRPFNEVAALLGKIAQQAQAQQGEQKAATPAVTKKEAKK